MDVRVGHVAQHDLLEHPRRLELIREPPVPTDMRGGRSGVRRWQWGSKRYVKVRCGSEARARGLEGCKWWVGARD